MKKLISTLAVALTPFLVASASADTGHAFYGDPPDAHHPWGIHDPNRPQPPVVTPAPAEQPGKPPSDAVVLFDGSDLSHWVSDKHPDQESKWIVKDGAMQCVPGSGYIRSKDQFGDCQLHIEWAAPKDVKGDAQGRGNSGIFLMGVCEVQVLDNYNNPTYADGGAGSVYGVNPPLANPLRSPGEFQTVDIVFRRPIYKDGKAIDPGYVTVFLNGVLVQDHTTLEGATGHRTRTKPGSFGDKAPLRLQDHGNPVRYRNIWYRPLPPRAIEGGTDGPLTADATTAKRKDIAAKIRDDAGKLKDLAATLRLMESLQYEKDDATVKSCQQQVEQYVASLKDLPADKLESRKAEIKRLSVALKFLDKWKLFPDNFPPTRQIEQIIKANHWDKK